MMLWLVTLIMQLNVCVQEYGGERAYTFSLILVLANGTMTLFAMGLGVMRLSTTLGNLLGALMVCVSWY